MLNATHYDWTRSNIRYGLPALTDDGWQELRDQHGRERPWPGARAASPTAAGRTVWCNPGFRGIGPPPTTDTSHPKVDAYLWINRPGYAQSCGGQKIGWFLPRALSYVRWGTDWEGPPPKLALKRYSLRDFGVSLTSAGCR